MFNISDLPYDKTCPVIYDNDAHADVYTDELLLTLASAGKVDLRGMITSSPVNGCVNRETYELDVAGREAIVEMAKKSGMINDPDHYRGPWQPLLQPKSDLIEDTIPIDTPGSRLIIEEAKKASPEKPLVLIMGGPLTVVADAYLLDNSIADKIVIAWLGGTRDSMQDYNGGVDPWAAYIALKNLQMVQFPGGQAVPQVPRGRLKELPDSVFRQWIIDKRLPHVMPIQTNSADHDGQPVISLIRPDYIVEAKRVSFSFFSINDDGHKMPHFKEDPKGSTLLVTKADEKIASEVWWQAVSNPEAWHFQNPLLPEKQRPFYAAPFPIGPLCRIEVEDFDRGGKGVAYNNSREKSNISQNFDKYRDTDVNIIPSEDIPGGYNQGAAGGYCVGDLSAGDWLAYTIDVKKAGVYDLGIRTAAVEGGGVIHLEFDAQEMTGSIELPITGGELSWTTIYKRGIKLNSGKQVMKLVVDKNGETGKAAKLNYIELKRVR